MIPPIDEMQYCIMRDGSIMDGANGLAIGATEDEAWSRALSITEPWSIQQAIDRGAYVRRCFVGVVNP